jgi:rhodanese-related sulfurtransferase
MSFPGRVPEVGPAVAAEQLAAGAVALDVREEEEWEAGRIEGALHIPMGELAQRQAEIPGDRPIVTVCRSGARSAAVAQALIQAGYEAVNLAGGMEAWRDAGLAMTPDGAYVA